MKRTGTQLIILAIIISTATSCTSTDSKDSSGKSGEPKLVKAGDGYEYLDMDKQAYLDEIEALTEKADKTKAGKEKNALYLQMARYYASYAYKYPDDEKAPEYLYLAAQSYNTVENGQQAVMFLEKFVKEYKDHPRYPNTLFMLAFFYENSVKNLEKAEQYYKRFIEEFPEHELADDAEQSIKNLGKSPEEIVREFEEKQKQQAATDQ
jgi:tetratricopeptide (TPR) repeat protein